MSGSQERSSFQVRKDGARVERTVKGLFGRRESEISQPVQVVDPHGRRTNLVLKFRGSQASDACADALEELSGIFSSINAARHVLGRGTHVDVALGDGLEEIIARKKRFERKFRVRLP